MQTTSGQPFTNFRFQRLDREMAISLRDGHQRDAEMSRRIGNTPQDIATSRNMARDIQEYMDYMGWEG